MTKRIMIQGTASSVGKSVLTAALCRIFMQDGWNTAPFKSQNMSLNSFVTADGLEMGRAQAVQAQACLKEPSVFMNPILLKPAGKNHTQVIVNGKVFSNLNTIEYNDRKPMLKSIIKSAWDSLEQTADLIVIEGAGSCAEINLRENDLVNMGLAELVDSPVLLVADIDKGGVFASLYGTVMLLPENERARIKGLIINKFRGDISLLESGLKQLEELTGIPVIGVIPFMEIGLDEEDSETDRFSLSADSKEIEIAVIRLPYLSNFTDFAIFDRFSDCRLVYADKPSQLEKADMIIIPGTKNSIADLRMIKRSGLADAVIERSKSVLTVGICGGFQILGETITDPHGSDGTGGSESGLALLPASTIMNPQKVTIQRETVTARNNQIPAELRALSVKGYEIHHGETTLTAPCDPFTEGSETGAVCGNVWGTYLHGIFDSPLFTRTLLNTIRRKKGLPELTLEESFSGSKENDFDRIADTVRSHLNMDLINSIIHEQNR